MFQTVIETAINPPPQKERRRVSRFELRKLASHEKSSLHRAFVLSPSLPSVTESLSIRDLSFHMLGVNYLCPDKGLRSTALVSRYGTRFPRYLRESPFSPLRCLLC